MARCYTLLLLICACAPHARVLYGARAGDPGASSSAPDSVPDSGVPEAQAPGDDNQLLPSLPDSLEAANTGAHGPPLVREHPILPRTVIQTRVVHGRSISPVPFNMPADETPQEPVIAQRIGDDTVVVAANKKQKVNRKAKMPARASSSGTTIPTQATESRPIPVPGPTPTALHEGPPLPVADCCVCLNAMAPGQDLTDTVCLHRFHSNCLNQWVAMSQNNNCPLCRADLAPTPTPIETSSNPWPWCYRERPTKGPTKG